MTISLATAELTALIGSYMWPFFRIGALVMTAPVTGSANVPVRVRLMLAVALTVIIAPLLPEVPAVDPFSWPALMIIFQQLVIGIAMGFALNLVFNAVITGGAVVAMQMGLGFASMVDPSNGMQVPVISQLYLMFTTLIFLGVDGHLLFLDMLAQSFSVIPVGPEGLDRDAFHAIALWGSQMFAAALWLALPAVISLLVVNSAFGAMARAAPQLNIFVIGFPLAIIMGFVIILYLLPEVVEQFILMLDEGFALVDRVLGGG